MKNLIARFVREEEGQDLVEYIFLVGFIALLVTLGLQVFAGNVNQKFESIGQSVLDAGPAAS